MGNVAKKAAGRDWSQLPVDILLLVVRRLVVKLSERRLVLVIRGPLVLPRFLISCECLRIDSMGNMAKQVAAKDLISCECLRIDSMGNMEKQVAARDWLQLPVDTLLSIIRRLDHFPNDHARFGAVCKSWRSVTIHNRCHLRYKQLPVGLMVPGIALNSSTRRYFVLNYDSGFFEDDQDANSSKQLQVPHECVCHGSAYGWLFLTMDAIELNTKLFNPFTGAEIQLPSVATLPPPLPRWQGDFDHQDKRYVKKTVFSSNPSFFQQRSLAPLVILIIYGERRRLAYCRPGDKAWMALECNSNERRGFMDAIYYNDRFLALGSYREILALDIGTSSGSSSTHSDDRNCEVNMTQYACIPRSQYLKHAPRFLVELQGDLVALSQMKRYRCNVDDDMYDNYEGKDYRGVSHYGHIRTAEFRMLRFETNKQKWVEVKSLGNNVLFLGYNTSFSLRAASEYLGVVPNSIYFTNDCSEAYSYDMGIYNLTDNSINRLYPIGSQSTCPSPIWVARVPLLD